MAQLIFKTNMHCEGCVASVNNAMEKLDGITSWHADLNDKNHLLLVEADESKTEEIIHAVSDAGYSIEPVEKKKKKSWFRRK